MFTLFIVLHVIFCIFLILVILLQTGKGAGIGAAFGGGSQTVFGPRGAGSFIGKVTGAVAGLFMLTSMILAFLSTSRSDNVAKAVEALKAERATTVETVSLTEPKDTATLPKAEAAPAATVSDTAPVEENNGTDGTAEAASTDEQSTDLQAPDTAASEEAAAPAAAPVGLEKPAKPVKPVGLKPAKPVKPAKAVKPAPSEASATPSEEEKEEIAPKSDAPAPSAPEAPKAAAPAPAADDKSAEE